MSVVLFRVDERLIHGQVVVGWGTQLHADHIVVVDDEIADSAWEQELYVLGLPPDMTADFLHLSDARNRLGGWQNSGERVILLTRDVRTMLGLARGRLLEGEDVNIGGIHHAPGRREVLPYVFLSDPESDALRALADEGARVGARDLPAARRVDLGDLLADRSA